MRGRYRILLGAAPGVGKTYRMLQEGKQAHAEGRDVVIGYLEPHDRPETVALAEGLEVVPRLRAAQGSIFVEEMDVDAVIRRAPELALIDELAHTNATGMKHEKRYQDIDDVLDAGIDEVVTLLLEEMDAQDAREPPERRQLGRLLGRRLVGGRPNPERIDLRPEPLRRAPRASEDPLGLRLGLDEREDPLADRLEAERVEYRRLATCLDVLRDLSQRELS